MIQKIPFFAGLVIASVLSIASCDHTSGQSRSHPDLMSSSSEWAEYENNPVIEFNDAIKGIMWNDPTVIRDDSKYRMWLTGGEPFKPPIVVKVYEAVSDDGIKWSINLTPVLEPGKRGTWDDLRTETPTVIKVADTYHMYYSGCDLPCNTGVYDIGHATSKDGTHWQKDKRNPVVKHHNDPLKWGNYTVAEPAIIHHEGTFYLYYTSAKSNYPDYGSPFGILLATSKDGSHFKEYGAVYTLTETYDPKIYRGYSTPAVIVSGGLFHLYHDVIYSPDSPNGFDQVAISNATSTDGFSFNERETNIISVEEGWKSVSVLAPTVLADNGAIKLWFSARTNQPAFGGGIGYAEKAEDNK